VKVPPYFGAPRLSHQFPVELVVDVTAAVVVVLFGVDTTVDVVAVVVIDSVVVAVNVVVDVAVVAEPQDANTSDIITRLVSNIQNTPLFI
jgi:hypothetical protein